MNVFPSPLGDLYIGRTRDGLKDLIESCKATAVTIIADNHTANLCLPLLHTYVNVENVIIIPAGEGNKNLDSCQQIWSGLIRSGADRSGLILNVGGGMICDLGGFAASCYQRGIRFGHLPTSLLAMADAAIGGKNGVNYQSFKNYIGRFDPPTFIWVDPLFLQTLPHREILAGLAEIVKHAIIGSPELWEILSDIKDPVSIDWTKVLTVNARIKQRITEADPSEKGLRKTLNFGHTIGHALESHFLSSPDHLSHGQAVTLGMLVEARLAHSMGLLGNEDFHAIITLITRLLSPYEVTLPSLEALRHWLDGDKKKSGGIVGYSLPDRIGSCGRDIVVEERAITESLDWLKTYGRV